MKRWFLFLVMTVASLGAAVSHAAATVQEIAPGLTVDFPVPPDVKKGKEDLNSWTYFSRNTAAGASFPVEFFVTTKPMGWAWGGWVYSHYLPDIFEPKVAEKFLDAMPSHFGNPQIENLDRAVSPGNFASTWFTGTLKVTDDVPSGLTEKMFGRVPLQVQGYLILVNSNFVMFATMQPAGTPLDRATLDQFVATAHFPPVHDPTPDEQDKYMEQIGAAMLLGLLAILALVIAIIVWITKRIRRRTAFRRARLMASQTTPGASASSPSSTDTAE